MNTTIRRVVTTHDARGLAHVLSDQGIGLPPLPGIDADARGAVAWTTEHVPADNMNDVLGDARDAGATIRSGSVFRVTEFGPGFESPMHRTHSIDYCAVLSGDIELVLDSGESVRLTAGDIAVQRGTAHAWRNPSKDTCCRILVIMIEAGPIMVDGAALPQHF